LRTTATPGLARARRYADASPMGSAVPATVGAGETGPGGPVRDQRPYAGPGARSTMAADVVGEVRAQ
jgi:hypothetical protein